MRRTSTYPRLVKQILANDALFTIALLQYDLGEPIVIEPQDESPFMKFGYVYPGQTVPALYNNLIRAPLFRHKSYPTDFLVIRFVRCYF